ncbi:hypothetical protein ACE1EB_004413 [Salmonella enterica]
MKRYHVLGIALLAGLVIGCAIPAHANGMTIANSYHAASVTMHRDRALCLTNSGTVSIYDNGTVYASNPDSALIVLHMDREHPEISNAQAWVDSVKADSPYFRCELLP